MAVVTPKSDISFGALSEWDIELIREWRNADIAGARTPFLLTAPMQLDFYRNEICNRASRHRYWSIQIPEPESVDEEFGITIGIAGLTDIEWENSCAEISLMIAPHERGKGYGGRALTVLLEKAFCELNLNQVFGVCYECNESLDFWWHMIERYGAETCTLRDRKYHAGRYWDAIYFAIFRDDMSE